MQRETAINKIMTDLGLPESMEGFVRDTMSRLGVTEDKVDLDTVTALKTVIRRDLR